MVANYDNVALCLCKTDVLEGVKGVKGTRAHSVLKRVAILVLTDVDDGNPLAVLFHHEIFSRVLVVIAKSRVVKTALAENRLRVGNAGNSVVKYMVVTHRAVGDSDFAEDLCRFKRTLEIGTLFRDRGVLFSESALEVNENSVGVCKSRGNVAKESLDVAASE